VIRGVTVAVDDGRYAVSISVPLDDYSAAQVHQLETRMLAAMDQAYDEWRDEQKRKAIG
jgi:hypothetical protein